MSRTMIMLSCASSKIPLPTTSCTFCAYPRVRYASDEATRSGVRRSPSRSGSSPSRINWRRTMSINSPMRSSPSCAAALRSVSESESVSYRSARVSVTVVLHVVVFRFPQPHPRQTRWRDVRGDDAPDTDRDVLRGRVDAVHEIDLEIQIAMVDLVDDFALDDALDLAEVDHIPGAIVHGTTNQDLKRVVVPVP